MPAEKMPNEVKSGFENDIANGGTKVEIDVYVVDCGQRSTALHHILKYRDTWAD